RRAVTLTSARNFAANSGSFANGGSSTFIAPRMSPAFSTERTIPIPPWPSLPRTTHLVPGMGSPIAYSIELGAFMACLRARRIPSPLSHLRCHTSPHGCQPLEPATFKFVSLTHPFFSSSINRSMTSGDLTNSDQLREHHRPGCARECAGHDDSPADDLPAPLRRLRSGQPPHFRAVYRGRQQQREHHPPGRCRQHDRRFALQRREGLRARHPEGLHGR